MAGVEGKVSVVIDSVSSLLAVAGQGGIQAVSSKLRRLASSIKVPFPSHPIPPPSHIDGNHPSPPPISRQERRGCIMFIAHQDVVSPRDCSSLAYMCNCTVKIHPAVDSFPSVTQSRPPSLSQPPRFPPLDPLVTLPRAN